MLYIIALFRIRKQSPILAASYLLSLLALL
jgi:hypothetical protein